MRTIRTAVIAAITALSLAACGDTPTDELSGEIVVFAAASLTESFETIGEQFEDDNPAVTVTFNFAGSSALSEQINQGAPADVFASASPVNMDEVVKADGIDGEPVVFVGNVLQIAVPEGNPADITGLEDFADPDLKIGLCAEDVPCGAAAQQVFEIADITPEPDTYEKDVKAVLTKVRLGELDAALVYRTDVMSAEGEVEGIEFDEAAEVVNEYPIGVCAEAPNPEVARAFTDYVLSEDGLAVLAEAGFITE